MSKHHNIILATALLSLSTTAFCGIDDYELHRLPISVGNEFTNAVGDVRQFMPTSINNAGLMAGTRLTWTPDGNGRTTGVTNQASYIYDLESRTYLAQPIAGMAITHIGDEVYLGKKLHPNGQRWQTWRCPISGLVEDAARGVWTNPECDLIDNDYLDQNLTQGDWAGAFIFGNYARLTTDLTYSNARGGSLVLDFPDDATDVASITFNYYKSDGLFRNLNDYPVLNDLFDPNGQSGPAKFVRLSSENGSDVIYEVTSTDGASPETVHRVEIVDGEWDVSRTSLAVDWLDVETGDYVTVVTVTDDGYIVTNKGICSFNDFCSNKVSFEAWPEEELNRYSDFGVYIDADVAVAAGNMAPLCNSSEEQCALDVYFYEISSGSWITFSDKVHEKFPEKLDIKSLTYSFPGFANVSGPMAQPNQMRVSRNGKYVVFTARDANAGTFRNYVMKRSD